MKLIDEVQQQFNGTVNCIYITTIIEEARPPLTFPAQAPRCRWGSGEMFDFLLDEVMSIENKAAAAAAAGLSLVCQLVSCFKD